MSKYSQDVVKMLYDNQPEYISGQMIADQLQISRTAVKKIIDQLKAEGCVIHSVNHRGHQLEQLADTWYPGIVEQIVDAQGFFDDVYVYDTIDSTQLAAKQKMVGHQNAMLVLSNEQTKGRGRFNRFWDSAKGKGLWMSAVFRPKVPFSLITTFNLFMALAIRESIQPFSNDKVEIKWPNDIYIGSKKVCGFLTEMSANSDGIEAVICGIGINMNQHADEFPEEIAHRATSIFEHADQKVDRYAFLDTLLKNMKKRYIQFLTVPFESIRDEYRTHSNIWHRTLKFTENDEQFSGQAIDIDKDGFLLVVDEAGTNHRLMSADIDL
ncbi:biotin--[acetyl-CoA-carboxylase] ligase [Staphylococcus simulans]|uniref:biotin--[acetyl-CoA-carboxylase] ligase n=1 Tax=Staphylococcus simulans TaxID=1286 RepID=UPI0021D11D54|nr:biotin--[acetyl-CoA-carboxylase] ligase [Staphylococcus simulans]UXR34139.1 biotin--[acetyl-CoA-carboxylase] ligase [Staphylococcus simulans]